MLQIRFGTEQWGAHYGVSNAKGQTPLQEVRQILEAAERAGITLFDTASLYGNAEQTLGHANLAPFRVITKTPKFGKAVISNDDVECLAETFSDSLKNLSLKSVYGLLIHNPDDFFVANGVRLIDAIQSLKSQGLVLKIGISVYTSSQIKKALDFFKPDIIQLPINVFDQRLVQDGTISYLSGLGIEVHARSAFLQGLLLMNPNEMPSYFHPWKPLFMKWQRFCTDQSISSLHAALGFVCRSQRCFLLLGWGTIPESA